METITRSSKNARTFKLSTYQTPIGWFLRWQNTVFVVVGEEGPFSTEQEALDAKQRFIDSEKSKYWWTLFE